MLGKPVPDFSLRSTGGGTFRLSSARASTLVLYFYPKDNTPGCTTEGADFRDLHKEFRNAGAEVFGVSRDAQLFGVIKMKTCTGERSAYRAQHLRDR
ncbi:MAG TPA: peroxiredoxin [Burkholderiales bacterium]|nr:peroxiredoxin [Burkholderiales bacterium]